MGDDFEALLSSRGYVLGETAEYYGIWHRAARDEPLERFPLTAEGFEAAERRFHELTRRRRRDPDRPRMVLLGIVVGGAALWLVSGLLAAAFGGSVFAGATPPGTVLEIVSVVDTVAYRLAVGALFVLAGLVLVRRDPERLAPSDADGSPSPALDSLLRWSLVIGLGAWIVSAVGTRTLEPPVPPGFLGGPRTSGLYVAATLLEALAFRVWVAAAVVLVATRLPRPRSADSP